MTYGNDLGVHKFGTFFIAPLPAEGFDLISHEGFAPKGLMTASFSTPRSTENNLDEDLKGH